MTLIKKNDKETILNRLETMEFYVEFLANMKDDDKKKDLIVSTLINDIRKIQELIG